MCIREWRLPYGHNGHFTKGVLGTIDNNHHTQHAGNWHNFVVIYFSTSACYINVFSALSASG